MSILTRIASFIGADPRGQRAMMEQRAAIAGLRNPPWEIGKPQWVKPNVTTFDQEAYRKVVLAWRCTQYLANATGAAPLRVNEPDDDPVDSDHPMRQLLDRPNPGMGQQRFLSHVTMVMAVAGFCVIEKERDRAGNVIGLWPLRPDWLRPIPRQQDMPDWEYRVPGYDVPFRMAAEDVIPLTFADTPDGGPLGIGPTEIMLREAQVSSALTDFLKVFMDRGALPLYAIIPQDEGVGASQWTKQETKDSFMEAWKQRYGGLRNAADPLPMVGVKDIKPIGFDFNQLAYPALNDLTDARICSAYGIPPILVGAQVGLNQATYSNYGQARQSFYEDTMTYLWARIDDAFTRHLLPEFEFAPGWDIQFDIADVPALQDNTNDRWQRGTSAFSTGLVSRHMAQREMGLEPQGDDVFLVPFNLVASPNGGSGARARYARFIEHGQVGMSGELTPANGHVPIDAGELKSIEPRIITREGRRYLNRSALPPDHRARIDTAITVQRRSIDQLATLLEPPMHDYLAAQAERIADTITVARSLPSANGTSPEQRAIEDIDWTQEDDLLRAILEAWMGDVERISMASATALTGTSWDVSNPFLAMLRGTLGHRIRLISDTTRQTVETIVRDSLIEGTTMPDLAAKLKDQLAPTYKGRAENVARTESMNAYGHASQMAYEQSGVVTEAMIADNAAHSESYKGAADGLTCSQRDGLVVPVNRITFHVGSDHPRGSAAAIPIVQPVEGA